MSVRYYGEKSHIIAARIATTQCLACVVPPSSCLAYVAPPSSSVALGQAPPCPTLGHRHCA